MCQTKKFSNRFLCQILLLCCLFLSISKGQIPIDPPPNPLETLKTPSYLPNSKIGYLGTSITLTITGSLIGAGVLYLLPESVTKWNKEDLKHNLGSNYLKQIKRGPVVDGDEWWLNWITHPYWGAVYYLQTRRAGFNWAFSSFYSFLCSTLFWEYGFEAFAEVPSWQDLIVTPAIGSLLGELFFLGINYIQNNDSKLLNSRFLGAVSLFLLDPIGFIIQDLKLGEVIGLKNKEELRSFYLPKKDGISFMLSYRW